MASDLILNTGRRDEDEHAVLWDSGPVRWVVKQIRVLVTDEHLRQEIPEYAGNDYVLFSLGAFSEPQIEQLLAIILDGRLLSAARREWPPDKDPYNMAGAIEELARETRQWLASVNAQRRAEGRPELKPSLGEAPNGEPSVW